MKKWEKDYFNLIDEEKKIIESIQKVSESFPINERYRKSKDLENQLYENQQKQVRLLIDNAESVDFMPDNWR
jgi:hypothetical protein